MENRISMVLPHDVEALFKTKISEAFDLIKPFIVTINEDDKASLLKLGEKTTPFVQRVSQYVDTDPEFLPNFLNSPEFKKDTTALLQYNELNRSVDKLQMIIDDTRSLLANDSYAAALIYYNAVKLAAKNGDGKAKVIYEELSQWFPGRSAAKKDNTGVTNKI